MESSSQESALRFVRYEPSHSKAWKDFLLQSNNGTLFHDLDFLAYHHEGKFELHHLLIYQDEKLIALLPAAVVESIPGNRFLKSPYGASVGGWVVATRLKVQTALDLALGLQSYACGQGWTGLELRLAPNSYMQAPNDVVPFALKLANFKTESASLVFMVPLGGPRETLTLRLLSATKRNNVRASLKKGLRAREVDESKLPDFYQLLLDSCARHQAMPTHTYQELRKLFQLVPGRLRLFLCQFENEEIAGVLLFIVNKFVATTFYVCERQDYKNFLFGPAVLHAFLIETMAEEGFRYLDLGPSISDSHHNEGTVFFKESMGAQGFCRQTWSWQSAGHVPSSTQTH